MKNNTLTRHCKPDRHVRRDNNFGVTWCIRCGALFNKPCGKTITPEDRLYFKIPKLYENKSNKR